MKIWILAFSLMTIHLFAEDNDFKGKPAGLLTFSPYIPIELNASNEKVILSDNASQIERNQEIDGEKTFPLEKLFLGLIAALGFLALRYFPRQKEDVSISLITAKEHAEEKMQLLEAENLKVDDRYAALIYILRTFIEERYGINAPVKTTEEFLSKIKETPISSQFSEEVFYQILALSDLVKFAKKSPDASDYSKAYNLVSQLIEL